MVRSRLPASYDDRRRCAAIDPGGGTVDYAIVTGCLTEPPQTVPIRNAASDAKAGISSVISTLAQARMTPIADIEARIIGCRRIADDRIAGQASDPAAVRINTR